MKIGKTVWWQKKGQYVSGELLEFGKGEMARIKMPDGSEREVRKMYLLAKKPK